MLNNTISQNLTFNSVVGTLVRSHRESEFRIVQRGSQMAERLFSENSKSVVLQVMLYGDDRVMVEYLPNGYEVDNND